MTDELDALVKPLVWTEESPNCWIGRGSFGFQRDFRVFDGVAKVRIGTIGARVTPDRARSFYDREYVEFVLEAIDTAAITTLRGQLAAETRKEVMPDDTDCSVTAYAALARMKEDFPNGV